MARATPLGVPGVPESLVATEGDGEVVLEWTAPADDGGSPVTGYEYRYVAGDGVPDGTPWQDAGTELGATVTGLENETRYALEVRARNRAGPGAAAVTTATPIRLEAELFSAAAVAAEGEPLVIGLRRSGGLAHAAHAYIGVTDSAVPVVGAADEGRADGLGRHRLEFATGATEATVTVTPTFDGERGEGRVITATVESVEVEIGGAARAYELVTAELVFPVTDADAVLSVSDARADAESTALVFTVSLDRTRDVAVRVDYATEDGTARAGEDYTPVSGTLTIEARREGGHGGGGGASCAARDGRTDAHPEAVECRERGDRRRGGDGHDRSRIRAAQGVAGAVRADGVGPRGTGDREAARGRAAGDTGDGGGPACGRPVGGRPAVGGAAVGRMEAGFGC